MPAEGPATPLRQCGGPGRGPRSVPGRRPILARPATLLEQTWKRARRRPTEAMLVSAIAATAILGFALVLWQWRRAETKAAAEAAANLRASRPGGSRSSSRPSSPCGKASPSAMRGR